MFNGLFAYEVFKLRILCTTGMSNSSAYVGRIGEILAGKFAAGGNLVTKKVNADIKKSSLELFGSSRLFF